MRFGSQPELSQGLHCPPQGHEGRRLQAQVSSCQEDSAMFFQHCCDPMLSCLVTKGFRLLRIGGSEEERQRRKSIFQLLPHPHSHPTCGYPANPRAGPNDSQEGARDFMRVFPMGCKGSSPGTSTASFPGMFVYLFCLSSLTLDISTASILSQH